MGERSLDVLTVRLCERPGAVPIVPASRPGQRRVARTVSLVGRACGSRWRGDCGGAVLVAVRDDEAGLLLWMQACTEIAGLEDVDNRNLRTVPLDEIREPRLVRKTWGENDVLILMPPGAAHSVWWFFRPGGFAGWYVNLETPYTRHDEGVDATNQVLDVVVAPDRTWVWKDEDEMADRTGRPNCDRDGADEIRAEGSGSSSWSRPGPIPSTAPGPTFARIRLGRHQRCPRDGTAWACATNRPNGEATGVGCDCQ